MEGKEIGLASICLSDSGTQKEVLRSSIMGGNEPSELKEEVKRGKSIGLNQQTGFWGVSAVLYRIWELTQLLWNTEIPEIHVSWCWCSFGMNIGP